MKLLTMLSSLMLPQMVILYGSIEQLTDLFERDKSTISRHIRNVFKEGELERAATVAKFATVQTEGNREITRYIEYYNLDVIISVGYRVKSQRGIEFRKWANKVLKDYIIKEYAVNNKRIKQICEVIRIMKRAENQLDAKQVLSVIDKNNALFLDDAKTEKTIADQTLDAFTIMIAESQPAEKEMMINVIMNCMIK